MVRNQTVDNICDLPIELLELIFGYVSYDEIAKIRAVCRQFDASSQRLLNRGFVRVEKYHSLCFKRVKAQLPRRESERRSHPLARHCDVLSAIETRLSLLGMTYMKYVEMSLCCFIPGKVIDEIYRVLRFIHNNPNPPRVHELLQELRDISSMAMEYFEEKIAPSLKNKLSATTSVPLNSSAITTCHRPLPSTSGSPAIYQTQRSGCFGEQEMNKSNNLLKQIQTTQNTLKKELNDSKVKLKDMSVLKRDMSSIKTKTKELERLGVEKDQTIAELRAELEDLKRRMNEYDKKNAVKTIKDEQHLQKEVKAPKRKSQRISTIKSKRLCNQLIEIPIETEVQPMEVSVKPKTRNSSSNKRNAKPMRKVAAKPKPSPMSTRKQTNDSRGGQHTKRRKTK